MQQRESDVYPAVRKSQLRASVLQAARLVIDLVPGAIIRHGRMVRVDDSFAPRLAGRRSDLVVEGFPRSANTFCYYYLQLALPNARIAHHMHSWQQFLVARLWGIPSLVIVREPDASIASLITKYPDCSVTLSYLEYALFNSLSAALAGRVVFFEQVTSLDFMSDLADQIAVTTGEDRRSVGREDVGALMASRTVRKNRTTRPLAVESLSRSARIARAIAQAIFNRIRHTHAARVV